MFVAHVPVTERLRSPAHFKTILWTPKCLYKTDCHHDFAFVYSPYHQLEQSPDHPSSLSGSAAGSPMTTVPTYRQTKSADAVDSSIPSYVQVTYPF